MLKVFLIFLLVRLASVYVVRTFFVPDEYWQSLEVSHKLVFGYGFLTWEWTKGIRNYFYPAVIAGIYKVLALLNLDTAAYLIYAPRIAQAVVSAVADYHFYLWTNRKKWGVFMIVSSWFWFYTASRTLTNTLETALTTIALSYFPWNARQESSKFLIPVIVATVIRPTAIIPWIPLCIYHTWNSKSSAVKLILTRYVPLTVIFGGLLTAVDWYFYNRIVFTPYEFLKFNVIDGIGEFYGSQPWYWYVTNGLPTVLGIGIVPFALSTIQTLWNPVKEYDTFYGRHFEQQPEQKIRKILLCSIAFTLVVYSLLSHKEFRFILAILPMCIYISVDLLSKWSERASDFKVWLVAILLFVGDAGVAGYFGWFHKSGTIEMMPAIRDIAVEYQENHVQHARAKILFLMPCHPAPAYSYLHANASLRFLACEPNFDKKSNYIDEADNFFAEPAAWLRSHIPVHPLTSKPTHIVMYDTLVPQISVFLNEYKQVQSFFSSDILMDPREGHNIIIYERHDIKSTTSDSLPKETPPANNEL